MSKEEKIKKDEADIWNKMYSGKTSTETKKEHYKPLNEVAGSVNKNEADLWNTLYKDKTNKNKFSTKIGNFFSKFKKVFTNKKIAFSITAIVIVMIAGGIYFTVKNGNLSYFNAVFAKNVPYTKNPAVKNTPLESVVKIIVEKDTDKEASGSGILFTSDGYILTNAHVITTELGKNVKNIKVCYTTKNNQEVKCDYDAHIIDADRSEDIALIKTDRPITEIKPYPIVVQEDDESWTKEILPLGTEIKAVGFPGVGGNSITITKGIVSGYKNGEIIYDDGSLQKIPFYIKTDTEINYGNSGGAVFDKDNRYIGISSAISKDDGGKLSLVIYWNKINLYLNHLVFKGVISLPEKQYIKRHYSSSENDLWTGIKAYFKEDYKASVARLETYTKEHGTDSRGWTYLCEAYQGVNDIEKMENCAVQLRTANPKAQALSWYLTSYYNSEKEVDNNKAFDSITKALNAEPENTMLLGRKAELEVALNKYTDAKNTAEKILRIDETNNTGWYYLGVVALNDDDYDTGIKYLELSFNINPDASVATYLSELYDLKYAETLDSKDLLMTLIYRVNSVILNQHSIGDILSLAGTVTTVFESDTEGTWGSSLKLVKDILEKLEVDKSLVDPVGGVSDSEIKEYLKGLGGTDEEIKQQDIDGIRYFVKMTMAWLYTFIGEKNACTAQFNDISKSDLVKVLIDAGIEEENATNIIKRNVTLECLCVNDDYSNDVVNACYARKIKQVFNN